MLGLSFDANGFHKQEFYVGSYRPYNLPVSELTYATEAEYRNAKELQYAKIEEIDLPMLMKKEAKDSMLTELALEDQLVMVKPNTWLGNSGGPLINENGKVIGVVVSKIAGDGYEGLGFAIPVQVVLNRLQLKYP